MLELTIKQATLHPANFMYIWADEERFLKLINPKYAEVIRVKKDNQKKLILLSAREYINKKAVINGPEYQQYTEAIRSAFIDAFGCTPFEGLVKLAKGEQLAGKNWSAGVFGVGTLNTNFNNTSFSVDADTGTILDGGVPQPESNVVYGTDAKGNTIPFQVFTYDNTTGRTYMSQYNKATGKYVAKSYSTDDGKTYNRSGEEQTTADSGSVWETVIMSIQSFINWLLSLFGYNTSETLNETNTLPNQTTDGFVQEAGMGEAGVILLALAAGGALIAGGSKKKGKK